MRTPMIQKLLRKGRECTAEEYYEIAFALICVVWCVLLSQALFLLLWGEMLASWQVGATVASWSFGVFVSARIFERAGGMRYLVSWPLAIVGTIVVMMSTLIADAAIDGGPLVGHGVLLGFGALGIFIVWLMSLYRPKK